MIAGGWRLGHAVEILAASAGSWDVLPSGWACVSEFETVAARAAVGGCALVPSCVRPEWRIVRLG